MTAPVRLDAVRKTYGNGAAQVTALDGITVDFPAGRVTAVMGPSGSGWPRRADRGHGWPSCAAATCRSSSRATT